MLFQIPRGATYDPGGGGGGAFPDNIVHLLYYLPPAQVVEELKEMGRGDILVVCGGVIPPKDYQFLYDCGVAAIYGPGTNIPVAAYDLVGLIEQAQAGTTPSGKVTGHS